MKRTKKEQHDARFIFLMLFPALLVPICMTYYPMFKGIVMAFQNYKLTNINNIYPFHHKRVLWHHEKHIDMGGGIPGIPVPGWIWAGAGP